MATDEPADSTHETATSDSSRPGLNLHRVVGWRPAPTIVGSGFLCAVALVAYLRRILHGGFLSDDWVQVSLWHNQHSFSGFLRSDLDSYPFRPGDVFGLSLLYRLFGEHAKGHLGFSILISVIASVLFAEILRRVGFAALHAYLIGAIALAAPFATGARLWAIMGVGVAGVVLCECAILVGLRGGARGRRSFVLHTLCAGLLAAANILTYEVTAGVLGACILLYLLVMPARRAIVLWAVTMVGVGAATAFSSRARASTGATEQTSLSRMPDNARRIIEAVPDLVSRATFPIDSPSGRFAIAGIAVIAGFGILVAVRAPDPARRLEMRRWLLLLAGGAVVALAGWAVFVASTGALYTPTDPGIGNRVNLVSSFGLAAGAYALGAITLGIVSSAARLPSRVAIVGTAAIGVAILIPYIRQTRTEVATYQQSYGDELAIIGWFQEALPNPPANSVIFLYGAPLQIAPGVPVFGSTWELAGALQVLYSDPTIRTVPISPAAEIRCTPDAILVNGGDLANVPYGQTYVANYRARTVTLLRDPSQCTAVTSKAPVSPWIG